jgi:hypothetical protein
MPMGNWTLMCKLLRTSTGNHKRGIGIFELIVAMGIVSFCLAVIFSLLGNAQSSFFNADTNIDLRNTLRVASDKMTSELRNTGYKGGVAQFAILTGSGTNGTDIIRFAIPILCTSTMTTILDGNGDPAYWGAPLTWGCNTSSCMDADNDCSIQEYRYIQYSLNASKQLERKVLNSALTTVSTTIMATDIIDFDVSLTNEKFTITLTGQKISPVKNTLTAVYTSILLINNQGG